jgi:hypothetical protein
MLFRTTFDYAPCERKISFQNGKIFLGSCFATEMGEKMQKTGFDTLLNPFGTIFNSASLLKIFEKKISNRDEFVYRENLWVSLNAGAKICAESPDKLAEKLQNIADEFDKFLKNADTIILTLGTAWVYTYQKTGNAVANCQKIPQKEFTKVLQTPEEVLADLRAIKSACEGKNLILTLSPVRHGKDTFPLNSVSKSVLRYALFLFCREFPDVYYLPVYEWILDDLRDYRFFKRDMLHPSEEAVDYVWGKFLELCFDEKTKEKIKIEEKNLKFLAHRPLGEL